ncbi:MAG: RelA/SpoT family protein [Sphingomonadales bacterium]
MIRQYELVERVKSYDSNVDETLLNRAYVFSMKAHGSQKRASGDPYFSHPLEVAGILTNRGLDCATIATALLHDTIEDTVATYEEIEELFGEEVARLVDGVTKLSRIELNSESTKQAENFRKFLLAMSDDIRVLLVKLADRLHNMRTLKDITSAAKRRRIALETQEIYAPLAERIGIQEWKDELEDTSFAELNPEARDTITTRLRLLREESGDLTERVTTQLRAALAEHGIAADVMGREKRPFSIWRKMKKNRVSFGQLSDIMGFRILVDGWETCYRVLGVVHGKWQMVPDRFKDYLSTPKSNNYRSLHTTVIGPEQQRIEIQIRTHNMQEVAEWGVAAHWQYKQGSTNTDGTQYRWLRELLEILDHASSPEEFLENTKMEMFQDQVFCFSPKGEVIRLPRGATPVDFAYAVHTGIGNTCVGAKVNGGMVPLDTELENGDEVRIVRSQAQTPMPAWENFVITGKARAAIRRFIRTKERSEFVELGKTIINQTFQLAGHEYSEKGLERTLDVLKYQSLDDLQADLGQGLLTLKELFETIFPGQKYKGEKTRGQPFFRRWGRKRKESEHAIPITGLIGGMAVDFAGCCHPIRGDRIVGIVTKGSGITVHTIDCEALENFSDEPDRWLDVAWDPNTVNKSIHVGRIKTLLVNEAGALGTLATVIAKNDGNISNLKITERNQHFFGVIVDVEVRDVKHLTNIIAALRATAVINLVERVHG